MGTASLVAACVAWGANIPMTALLFRSFDPYWLSAVRVTLAALLLGVVLALLEGPRALRVRMPAGRLFVLSGILGAFFLSYNLSLAWTHPITAAALQAGSPVYAAVVIWVLNRAPLERGFVGAAILTVAGGAIAVFGRAAAAGQGVQLTGGEPVVILSLVLWTLYSYLAQRWFPATVTQLQRTFVSMLGCIVWLYAGWAVLRGIGFVGAPQLAPDGEALTYLLLTGLFATAGGSIAWNIGVNRTSLMLASLWQNTVPVFGVLFSIAFGLHPTGLQLLGGAVVMSGVLYMQWQRFSARR